MNYHKCTFNAQGDLRIRMIPQAMRMCRNTRHACRSIHRAHLLIMAKISSVIKTGYKSLTLIDLVNYLEFA